MVDPFGTDPRPSFGAGAERARDDLNARFQHLRQAADETADAAREGESHRFGDAADALPGSGDRANGPASAANFRTQASKVASDARGTAASIADQARHRLTEIVDQQKAAGADKIAGVAKAAHSAANDLDGSNPQLAHLVRTAADGVDRIASDVRDREIGDVVDTLASFGRRQPVAFFGGAVLAGFLLARFFKSDLPVVSDGSPSRDPA